MTNIGPYLSLLSPLWNCLSSIVYHSPAALPPLWPFQLQDDGQLLRYRSRELISSWDGNRSNVELPAKLHIRFYICATSYFLWIFSVLFVTLSWKWGCWCSWALRLVLIYTYKSSWLGVGSWYCGKLVVAPACNSAKCNTYFVSRCRYWKRSIRLRGVLNFHVI